jgi:alkanesulfonate monooxygenase SsuD/methylene tetrahydromethanopterin reductase-like flavin-dependent oxidoreductase (luciferase family)
LRRDLATTAENFPHDVMELQALLGPLQSNQMVRAVPGAGLRVPIWLLGSSTFSAQLAAMLGLPFAFASRFGPGELMRALDVYRARFQPSEQLSEPYAMIDVNVLPPIPMPRRGVSSHRYNSNSSACDAARPDPCRRRSRTWMSSGRRRSGGGRAGAGLFRGGHCGRRRRGLAAFIAETGADELILTSQIYDHTARLRSFEIAAEIRRHIAARQPASLLRSDASIA